MRILFLSQLTPYPLDAGPKVRSYYVLRHLAEAGHAVTLLAFGRESDRVENIDHLRQFCAAVHIIPMIRSRLRDAWHLGRSLLSGRPFLIARDSVAAMERKARELVAGGRFDAIHADQLWMAQYALAAAAAANGRKPRLVLDQHNAMFLIPERLAMSSGNPAARQFWQREARAMRPYELATCRRFDSIVWVTAEDRRAVSGGQPLANQECVIPICVDPDAQPAVDRVPRPHRVTFLGGLHWPPNAAGIIWFAREVWPSVRSACPGTALTVIGKSPPAGLAALSGLEVTGYVDDPAPYLRETAAFIVPLHAGGGMRVKILDAWAWGLPVVSTTIGAEGIDYRSGKNLLIADRPEQLAAAVIEVLARPGLGQVLAAGGRETVMAGYDWRRTYVAWDAVYQSQGILEMECDGI